MTEREILDELYAQIPTFECTPGCTGCCGPVPFSKEEWDAVDDKREAISITCPYAEKDDCAIYANRPFMCRMFGAVEDLPCPFGCGPKKLLTCDEGAVLRHKYSELVGDCKGLIMKAMMLALTGGEK